MKKIIFILLLVPYLCGTVQAQDGFAFWSQSEGWSFDFDADGKIDKSFKSGLPEASNITRVFVGDYNKDGKFDLCEVSQAEGNLVTWYFFVNDGNNNFEPADAPTYGVVSDKPLAGDFMGSGKMQISVRRDNEWGLWWLIHFWGENDDANFQFGVTDKDILVAGDLNGDGKDDIIAFDGGAWKATFTPADGFPKGATVDIENMAFGLVGDIPVIADFNGDGHADIGLYNADDAEIGFNLYNSSKPENNGYSRNGRGSYDDAYTMPSGINPTAVCAIKKAQLSMAIGEENITNNQLSIYPNLLNANESNTIKIGIPQSVVDQKYHIVIYNTIGQQVASIDAEQNSGEISLVLPYLNSGTYVVSVNTGSYSSTAKLIIK